MDNQSFKAKKQYSFEFKCKEYDSKIFQCMIYQKNNWFGIIKVFSSM